MQNPFRMWFETEEQTASAPQSSFSTVMSLPNVANLQLPPQCVSCCHTHVPAHSQLLGRALRAHTPMLSASGWAPHALLFP